MSSSSPSRDEQPSGGTVDMREDAPLRARNKDQYDSQCGGGPRLLAICFGVLSVAVTVALITQIYYGDYEVILVVPHGSVSGDAALCSRAGTDALQAGGVALDGAVAAALCLAVLAPHNTGLDASGALLMWDYRKARSQAPVLVQWGAMQDDAADAVSRVPRLVSALAALHARYGRLVWSRLLEPAIEAASTGFMVSSGLSAASLKVAVPEFGTLPVGQTMKLPALTTFLKKLQGNTSRDWSALWGSDKQLSLSEVSGEDVGRGWRLYAGGRGSASLVGALASQLQESPGNESQLYQSVSVMTDLLNVGNWTTSTSAATGLAVVDHHDVYLSLVTGLSNWFGSGKLTVDGWFTDDSPVTGLMPAILVETNICGRRYVTGAADTGALLEVLASLAEEGDVEDITEGGTKALLAAVEQPRVLLTAGGGLGLESEHRLLLPTAVRQRLTNLGQLLNISSPYPSVNVVRQRGDQLASHADSRGQGQASRF